MKHLIFLLIIVIILSPWLANAQQATQTLRYQGQFSDRVTLSQVVTETQYRDEIQYQTCNRQVPYQEQVCQQMPQTRQECRQMPPQQQCRMEGGGMNCYMENGRRICRNEPPHQVCQTIPGQYVCQNVTYYENVCRYETRYRNESYSCPVTVRVPYPVSVTRNTEVDFEFENMMGPVQADFFVSLDNLGNVVLKAQEYSNRALIIARKDAWGSNGNVGGGYQNNLGRASFHISFLPKDRVLNALMQAPDQIQMTQTELRFVMRKSLAPQQLKVTLTIQGQGVMETRTFDASQLFMNDINPMQSLVRVNLQNAGLYLPFGNYNVTVDLSLDLGGEIINNNVQTHQARTVFLPLSY